MTACLLLPIGQTWDGNQCSHVWMMQRSFHFGWVCRLWSRPAHQSGFHGWTCLQNNLAWWWSLRWHLHSQSWAVHTGKTSSSRWCCAMASLCEYLCRMLASTLCLLLQVSNQVHRMVFQVSFKLVYLQRRASKSRTSIYFTLSIVYHLDFDWMELNVGIDWWTHRVSSQQGWDIHLDVWPKRM